MREARSVTVTAWINDQHSPHGIAAHEAFRELERMVEEAVEAWHDAYEDVVDGVPVVRLR